MYKKIWDNEKEHKRNAEWLRELRAEKDNIKQNYINKTTIRDEKRISHKDPKLEKTRWSSGLLAKEINVT